MIDDGLDKEGFLSCEIEAVIKLVRARYAPWLGVVYEINRFAVKAQHEIDVHVGDLREMLVSTLFARTLANVQGSVLLIERGMQTQARILLRGSMESLFNLAAITGHPELADNFAAADEVVRKRMLLKSRVWLVETLREEVQATATDSKLTEINESIRAMNAKELKTIDLAKMAGLEHWYHTVYALFSASVHSTVRDLQTHLVLGDGGQVIGLQNEAAIEDLDNLLAVAAEVLLVALDSLEAVFKYPVEAFRSHQRLALEKLVDGSVS